MFCGLLEGVIAIMGFFEVKLGNVGIYLCGGYISMTEEFLDSSKICPLHDKVGGKTMPKGVRGNLFLNICPKSTVFDNTPDRDSAHWFSKS